MIFVADTDDVAAGVVIVAMGANDGSLFSMFIRAID